MWFPALLLSLCLGLLLTSCCGLTASSDTTTSSVNSHSNNNNNNNRCGEKQQQEQCSSPQQEHQQQSHGEQSGTDGKNMDGDGDDHFSSSLPHEKQGKSGDGRDSSVVLDKKWADIINKIDEAVDNYQSCQTDKDGCSTCHYRQIKSDLAPYKSGITKEDLEAADQRAVTYQIIDHKVYREKKCVFQARCTGVEYFLTRLAKDLPDMEFKLNVFDYPCTPMYRSVRPPVFSFSRDHAYSDIMYPAWTFWTGGPAVWPIFPKGQGDWVGTRRWLLGIAEKHPWHKKQSKGFFIGSRTSADRDPLILLSRAKPELVYAAYTKNQAYKGPKDTLNAEPVDPKNYDEHCPYKYLFNFRGVAASFRLKHLFLCGSLVYHVGDDWLEFFYPAMKPWVHYLPVSQDLSDAEMLLNFAMENDGVAEQIANRGAQFIRNHLRQEDVFCYWKELLLEYSKLLKFKPTLNTEYELKTISDKEF